MRNPKRLRFDGGPQGINPVSLSDLNASMLGACRREPSCDPVALRNFLAAWEACLCDGGPDGCGTEYVLDGDGDKLGVSEAEIRKQSDDQIVIELLGVHVPSN